MKHGYIAKHDDTHVHEELARAGAYYALPPHIRVNFPELWPFEPEAFKPSPQDRLRELVKAGAMIAAEIDRQLRLSTQLRLSPESEETQNDD